MPSLSSAASQFIASNSTMWSFWCISWSSTRQKRLAKNPALSLSWISLYAFASKIMLTTRCRYSPRDFPRTRNTMCKTCVTSSHCHVLNSVTSTRATLQWFSRRRDLKTMMHQMALIQRVWVSCVSLHITCQIQMNAIFTGKLLLRLTRKKRKL